MEYNAKSSNPRFFFVTLQGDYGHCRIAWDWRRLAANTDTERVAVHRSRLIVAASTILVAAICFAQLNRLTFIRTTVYNTSDPTVLEAPVMPGFIQQSPDATGLIKFRRHIAPLLGQPQDDISKIVAIQHWVRGQENDYQAYYARGPMTDTTEDPEQYLEEQRRGLLSACRRFSYILNGALLTAGINARVVSVSGSLNRSTRLSHNLVEVWIEKRHKWILVDPTLDAFVLVNGEAASLLEVYAAAQPGAKERISFDQHGSHYRLIPLEEYRRYFRHIYVAGTNALFDGYRYGLLESKRITFVHYSGPGIEPYPERKKELLLAGLVVTAGLAAFLIVQFVAELLFWFAGVFMPARHRAKGTAPTDSDDLAVPDNREVAAITRSYFRRTPVSAIGARH